MFKLVDISATGLTTSNSEGWTANKSSMFLSSPGFEETTTIGACFIQTGHDPTLGDVLCFSYYL